MTPDQLQTLISALTAVALTVLAVAGGYAAAWIRRHLTRDDHAALLEQVGHVVWASTTVGFERLRQRLSEAAGDGAVTASERRDAMRDALSHALATLSDETLIRLQRTLGCDPAAWIEAHLRDLWAARESDAGIEIVPDVEIDDEAIVEGSPEDGGLQ